MASNIGRIEVTYQNEIAILVMNCGENRFNDVFVQNLHSVLDDILRHPSVTAVVTTGKGKFYSIGLDVNWATSLDTRQRDYFINVTLVNLFTRLLTFPILTIAALNGHAFAAGTFLSLVHDHVVMNDARGWWCMNKVLYKLPFSSVRGFGTQLIRGKLSSQTFHEALVLGHRYTAEEALSAGIVHQICPPNKLLPTAIAWVKTTVPPGGYNRMMLQTMKEDAYEDAINDLKKHITSKL